VVKDYPYTDRGRESNTFVREFANDLDDRELVWHRDKKDRFVKVMAGVGWQIQMDNQLPEELLPHHVYFIQKESYHRLIKGSGTLILEIKEDE
jgi:hypothetical protein